MLAGGSSFLYWYSCKNNREPRHLAGGKNKHHTQHGRDLNLEVTSNYIDNKKQQRTNTRKYAIGNLPLDIAVRYGLLRHIDD